MVQPINYLINLGGKRIRPLVTLMACDLFDGSVEDAIQPAVAVEVFHNFTLMHDDIMDQSPLRRNQETVHVKWNVNTAILSGDAMMIEAYQLMLQTRAEFIPAILPVFNTTALEVCEGQQQDMDFEKRGDVTVAEYIEMIRLKTSVLLAGALRIGAIIGRASEEDQKHIYTFGEKLGLSFQLMDDYLDAFGDPDKVGKESGGDIINDKKTFLLIKTMELANEQDRKTIHSLQGKTIVNREEKVGTIRAIMEHYNVDILLKEQVENYYNEALAHLGALHVSAEKKQPLEAMAKALFNREF
jgi:geranylgeranyl diphosphate synthase, type II